MLRELHGAVDPIYTTDKFIVSREFVLARQAGSYHHPTLWAVGWEGVLLDVNPQSVATPFERIGFTGDLKASLCNDIYPTEVA